jgi:hypothetical protein
VNTDDQTSGLDWKALVRASFDATDLTFGFHPAEEKSAWRMIREAHRVGASDEDIRREVRDFLLLQGAGADHIVEQMERLEDFLGAA